MMRTTSDRHFPPTLNLNDDGSTGYKQNSISSLRVRMTKKKKSNRTVDKADKNQHVARHGDFPHDAFDIALRRYAHPAAVSDHNLLTPGGPAWKRFLEAFGQSCLDIYLMISQRAIIQGTTRADALPLTPLDMDCPLVSAMSQWKGRQCLLSTQYTQ